MIGLHTFAVPGRTSMRGHAHTRALMMIVSEGALEEARTFAAHSGFRPVEYRALRRVAAALCSLSSGAPLAEVALSAGYSHQSHLTNAFRTLIGASPAQLRSAWRNNCARRRGAAAPN